MSKFIKFQIILLPLLFLISFVGVNGATLTVSNTNDSGAGSLRGQVIAAATDDSIVFNIPANSPGCSGLNCTIQLLSTLTIPSGKALIIDGTGANSVTLNRSGTGRVVYMPSGPARDVSLIGLTISGGVLNTGGNGAGIFFESGGTLTITGSLITNNSITGSAVGQGAGLFKTSAGGALNISNSRFIANTINVTGSARGAGLYSDAETSITSTTISGNSIVVSGAGNEGVGAGLYRSTSGSGSGILIANTTADNNSITLNGGSTTGQGGGLWLGRIGSVTNSTIGGNSVGGTNSTGSGIFVPNAGITLTFTSITVVRNILTQRTTAGGGGINVPPFSPQNLRNSVVALNTRSSAVSDDLFGAYTSSGYNLIGNGSNSTGLINGTNFDQVGTAASPIDPQLSPLQNFGGSTNTYFPLTGSPLIDRGLSFGLVTDQRGSVRPIDQASIPNSGDGSDIGAVEVLTPTSAAISINGRVTLANGRGAGNVSISVSGGSLAAPVRTITNQFGFYRIDGLSAGESYVISAVSKQHFFLDSPRAVNLSESLTDVNFVTDNGSHSDSKSSRMP